jgi:acetamidase/formamidase
VPVNVPGGLLCVGDGHAAQGDGEVGGTAIECPMTTELTVTVVQNVPVDAVHAVTPSGRVTFGFATELDTAAADALAAMLTWLQRLLGVDRKTALAYAGVAVDLHVTQVANQTWGVHARLASTSPLVESESGPRNDRTDGDGGQPSEPVGRAASSSSSSAGATRSSALPPLRSV